MTGKKPEQNYSTLLCIGTATAKIEIRRITALLGFQGWRSVLVWEATVSEASQTQKLPEINICTPFNDDDDDNDDADDHDDDDHDHHDNKDDDKDV